MRVLKGHRDREGGETRGVESERVQAPDLSGLPTMALYAIVAGIEFRRIKVRIESHLQLRKAYASFCLLVVVLLYAPLAGAAWSTFQSSCCKDGQCSIAAHHHQRRGPAAPKHQVDCGHAHGHEMSGMMACSMSCCHDTDRSVITPVAFLLPPSTAVAASFETTRRITYPRLLNFSRYFEPASPPPRS